MRLLLFIHLISIAVATIAANADAVVSARGHTYRSTRQTLEVPSGECGFEGNQDIYGLGIRLGYYFQWISSFLTSRFLSEGMPDLLDVNVIFHIAIFIVTTVLVTEVSSTYSIEVVILLFIFFGDLYLVQIPALVGHRQGLKMFSMFGLMLRVLIYTGMSAFSVWFWFIGIEQFKMSPCGSSVFLFAKVSLDGPARKAFVAFSVINMVIWGVAFLIDIIWTLAFMGRPSLTWAGDHIFLAAVLGLPQKKPSLLSHMFSLWQVPISELTAIDPLARDYGTGGSGLSEPESKEKRRLNPVSTVLALVVSLLNIIAIELTLAWNSILGIYTIKTTGQLIPFIIGACGLWKFLNDLVKARRKEKFNTVWHPGGHRDAPTTADCNRANETGWGSEAEDVSSPKIEGATNEQAHAAANKTERAVANDIRPANV